jgi:hypothetical protein
VDSATLDSWMPIVRPLQPPDPAVVSRRRRGGAGCPGAERVHAGETAAVDLADHALGDRCAQDLLLGVEAVDQQGRGQSAQGRGLTDVEDPTAQGGQVDPSGLHVGWNVRPVRIGVEGTAGLRALARMQARSDRERQQLARRYGQPAVVPFAASRDEVQWSCFGGPGVLPGCVPP